MALLVVLPEEPLRSVLPAGGSPAADKAYLAWRDGFLWRAADRFTWHGYEHPPPLEPWRFDAYVYRLLSDNGLFDSLTIYNHRLRFLAIAYRDRRRDALRAADRFIDEATRDVSSRAGRRDPHTGP